MSRFQLSTLTLLSAVYFAALGVGSYLQPFLFRASYLEGRFSLSFNDAFNWALTEGRASCNRNLQ